jgi:hypothetical protein
MDYAKWELSQTGSGRVRTVAYTDPSEFGAAPDGTSNCHITLPQPNSSNNGGTLYWVHPNYTGPKITTTVASLGLPPAALAALSQKIKTARIRMGHDQSLVYAPEDYTGWFLIILGIGLLVAAGVLFYFSLGDPLVAIWIAKLGIATVFAGVVVLGADSLFGTQQLGGTTTTANGSTCNTYSSLLGGCSVVCISPTGTTTTTDCTPGGGGLGGLAGDVEDVGIAIALIAAAGIGTYVAYKYVTRPKGTSGSASVSSSVRRVGSTAKKYAGKAYHGAKHAARSAYAGLRGKPATNPQFIVAKNGKTYLVSRRQK